MEKQDQVRRGLKLNIRKTGLLLLPLALAGAAIARGLTSNPEATQTWTEVRFLNLRDGAVLKGDTSVAVFAADGSMPGDDVTLDFIVRDQRGEEQSGGIHRLKGDAATSGGRQVRRFIVPTASFNNGVYYLRVANGGDFTMQERRVRVHND